MDDRRKMAKQFPMIIVVRDYLGIKGNDMYGYRQYRAQEDKFWLDDGDVFSLDELMKNYGKEHVFGIVLWPNEEIDLLEYRDDGKWYYKTDRSSPLVIHAATDKGVPLCGAENSEHSAMSWVAQQVNCPDCQAKILETYNKNRGIGKNVK